MSYTELAESRGISKKAAQRLTLRHRWRRQPANDGGVLVWVPEGAATPSRQTAPQTDRHDGGSDGPDVTLLLEDANKRADAALALADRTMVQLAEATSRIQQAEDRANAAHQRADRAEARADAVERALEQTRGEAQDAQNAARIATGALEAARQTEEARKARGRWARLRAAWSGR